MTAIETLISVLCGPDGKCCISGSDDDRRLIDSALAELAQATEAQPAPATQQAVEREQERIAFKDAHRHLELYEVPDAWGAAHVQALSR